MPFMQTAYQVLAEKPRLTYQMHWLKLLLANEQLLHSYWISMLRLQIVAYLYSRPTT